jgi:hypothetical protein
VCVEAEGLTVELQDSNWGRFTLRRRVALLVKIGPGIAEAEGFGGSNVEADNAVGPIFAAARRTEPIVPISSSIAARYTRYPSLFDPAKNNFRRHPPG